MAGDYDHLRDSLANAARAAIHDLLPSHPGESFYGFALFTDDDVASVQLAANSDSGLEDAVTRYGLTDARSVAGIRFATGEWKYEGVGAEHFRLPNQYLARIRPGNVARKHSAGYRREVLSMMVSALAELDADGLFGRGGRRDAITLLCAVTDATKAGEQYQDRSVRRLNPPAVVAAYEATMKAARAPKWSSGPPCPSCGKPLRTALARQCFLCGARWRGFPAAEV